MADDSKLGPPAHHPAAEGLFVFFSFDLVNSTRYKGINRDGWPFVTQRFYESVVDGMSKWLVGASVWKYVGDEVLMYKLVTRNDELVKCLKAASEVISATTAAIYSLVPDAKNFLDVKGALWCARVGRFENPSSELASREKAPNLVFQSGTGASIQVDFLGPDIDVGFRIAKHSARRRLVVSAELAYLLYLNRVSYSFVEDQLRIVSFEVLKGVWDDRRYPILWCEKDWSRIGSTFLYDEQYDNTLVRRVQNETDSLGGLKDLTKILDDQGRLSDVSALAKDLSEGRLADEKATLARATEFSSRIEVHCAAVCFRDDGRVLVAKRPADKRRYPGLWEFGCGQLAEGESFAQCLQRNYKADFGLEIEFIGEPWPIQSYSIDDHDQKRVIPGIVFVAFTHGEVEAKPTKHTEIDWIDPSGFRSEDEVKYVPAVRERLARAVAVRRQLLDTSGR